MPDVVRTPFGSRLSTGARATVQVAGSSVTAVLAATLVGVWTVVGLVRGFGHHWLDVLYASSGAVTFVMVFLIQHTSGRETRAILLKLDELIRATDGARDQFIAAEHKPLHEQTHLESTAR
jgi:low affinity Fe/Cu permease